MMHQMRRAGFPISCIFALSLVCAGQTGKVQSIEPLADKTVPQAVQQVLDPKGYRVMLDDGRPICELWIRKEVPAQPSKEVDGVAYPQLAESTLIGVLRFPQAASDYRGQGIPAGFYTLRYELMPDDGNHLGVAPTRDFLLLVPAASDADPTATFKFQELLALSRKATGTKHPGPMSLVPADKAGTGPSVYKDDQDHWIFSIGVKLSSAQQLPLALVVKGTAQQ